jgi:tellurite resistance-related uncharacterized protein
MDRRFMKTIPKALALYKTTPVYDQTSVPKGLLRAHNTKEGSWGKIIIEEGSLLYRILEPEFEEITLTPETVGVAEPVFKHEVELVGKVRFYVEFYK